MADRRTLIVAGLGRCGTSLAMRMLDAAGVPTVGDYPDWEDGQAQRLLEGSPAEWADKVTGKAVKVLDAHRYAMPELAAFDVLWLARDPKEQARSMLKLVGAAFSSIMPDRGSVRRMARSIERDTPVALRALKRCGEPHAGIALRFENIITHPLLSAQVMCKAFDIDPSRAEAMAAQVIRHRPECLPYLMEASLV